MPTFKVTDPETGRTVKLTGDSPPTEQELIEIFGTIHQVQDGVQREQSRSNNIRVNPTARQPQGQSSESFLDTISDGLENFTSEVLNTGTFGLSDIVGGLGSGLAEELFGSGDFSEGFDKPRKRREQFREENPKTSLAASALGAFINPGAGPAATFIGRGKNLVGTAVRSSVTAGGFSGAQTAGEEVGENLGKTLRDQELDISGSLERTGKSTLIGSTIGAVIPPLIKGGVVGFDGIKNLLTRFSDKAQGTRALRKIAEALERDGLTPQQALNRIDELGPEAALLDMGANTRALGFTVNAIPGKGKKQISDFISARQEGIRNPSTGRIEGGQVQRIQNHIDDLVKSNFFTERQQLANMNRSAKLYDSAYAANEQVESKAIDRILKTPAGKQAFQKARKTLQNLRTNLSKTDPELTAQLKEVGGKPTGRGVGKGLKLRFLDQVKQELFDLEEAAKTQFGKPTSRSRSITNLRRELIKEMDRVDATGGNYAQARLLAGDKLANQEALEKGADFLSKAKFSSPEELGVALSEMSPEARHLFRVGAAQSLKGKLADIVSRADATKKLIDIQSLEKKIQLAFGDKNLFVRYTQFLEKEKELFRAVTDVLGNSKTAERGAALADQAIDPGRIAQGLEELKRGEFIRGALNIFKGGRERLATPPNQSEALARVLTGRSIEGLKPIPPQPLTESGAPRSLQESLSRILAISEGTRIPNIE